MLRLASVALFVALFAAAAGGKTLRSPSDLAGLYSLRASLGLRARDWPRRSDPCAAWVGVACDGATGRVVSLNLSGLRRTRLGRLSPRFAVDGLQNLTRLVAFNASGFALPGPIPEWFGGLLPRSLAVLDLGFAAVSGAIPYSVSGATGLVVLVLAGNAITGNIPPTLGQLAGLSVLDISGNKLSGAVPTSLAALANLSRLDLSSNYLSGAVPPALGTLTKLRSLNLANNGLSGQVPPHLGDLGILVALDLSSNALSGSLPEDLKNLKSLQNLDLSNNALSGALTNNLFSWLSQLRSITLRHNNFSGELPPSLWSLSLLHVLDVSYNNLTGTLLDLAPAIGNANSSGILLNLSGNLFYGELPSSVLVFFHRFRAVDISGNYLDGALWSDNGSKNVTFGLNCFHNVTHQRSPAECEKFYVTRGLIYDGMLAPRSGNATSSKKSHHKLEYILIGAIGGSLLLMLLVILMLLCSRISVGRKIEQRETSGTSAPSGGSIKASGVPVNLPSVGQGFSYEQLVWATANFSNANLIKQGHSGDIYRGTLEGGATLVIKRLNVETVRKDAHLAELDLFSRGLHERLIPFVGQCLENENEKLLVYKYVPNGDLSAALQRKSGLEEGVLTLDWIKRLKIATGVAEALCYLHHECMPPLIHRDVQASSILLDDKFEVRLGSLSEVSPPEGEGHHNVITKLFKMSQTSEKNVAGPPAACAYDIYCFGKVLLELVTGKLGVSGSNAASTNEWLEHTLPYINIYDKDLVAKIVDPFLVVDEDHLEEVWAMAIVAKSCLNPKASRRPPMRYILKALENPLKVVRENSSSGSARLRATSSRGSWNAAFIGSWRRSSSDVASMPGQVKDDRMLKHSGTIRSQGSGGENSFSRKRSSKEIFPEPSGARDIEE